MFIIEGPDCVGKTTVANKIISYMQKNHPQFQVHYQHMTRPAEGFDFCYDYFDRISTYGVMDRFHLGALMYHPPVTLTIAAQRIVEGRLYARGSFILIMYASDSCTYRAKLNEHANQRKEMFHTEILIEANRKINNLITAKTILFDQIFDVTVDGSMVYPTDEDIRNYCEQWVSRLRIVKELQ
jgi:hypothetical protein